MSFSAMKRILSGDPEYINGLMEVAEGVTDWEWLKSRPDLLAATIGSTAVATGAGLVGAYSALAPENQTAQQLAEYANYVNPLVDSASEYVLNKHAFGMGNVEAGYKAGLSGAGQLGGQYLARKFLPMDEEGNQNQLAIFASGMGGEVLTDALAEVSYNPLAKLGRAVRGIR